MLNCLLGWTELNGLCRIEQAAQDCFHVLSAAVLLCSRCEARLLGAAGGSGQQVGGGGGSSSSSDLLMRCIADFAVVAWRCLLTTTMAFANRIPAEWRSKAQSLVPAEVSRRASKLWCFIPVKFVGSEALHQNPINEGVQWNILSLNLNSLLQNAANITCRCCPWFVHACRGGLPPHSAGAQLRCLCNVDATVS